MYNSAKDEHNWWMCRVEPKFISTHSKETKEDKEFKKDFHNIIKETFMEMTNTQGGFNGRLS